MLLAKPLITARVNMTPSDDGNIVELEIEQLRPPSWRLRPLGEQNILELMRSIQNIGLLQPVVVRGTHDGYQVVFGSHRIEACRRLGMKKIAAIVKHFTDEEAFLARVTENLLQNADINPIEEAEGYRMLVGKGWTINAIAKKVGKCDSYICERLAMLDNLDFRLRAQVSSGSRLLTPSHAELLSRIRDKQRQTQIAKLVETRRLSVRVLEDLLNGVPLPTKVQIEERSGDCWIHIPNDFAKVLGLKSGQNLYMYIRGRKLILETPRTRKNHTEPIRGGHAHDLIEAQNPAIQPISHVRMRAL
jgi:ParB family chromosome partitioning protein